eukprot:2232306-Prymnesium_polylepis.1
MLPKPPLGSACVGSARVRMPQMPPETIERPYEDSRTQIMANAAHFTRRPARARHEDCGARVENGSTERQQNEQQPAQGRPRPRDDMCGTDELEDGEERKGGERHHAKGVARA